MNITEDGPSLIWGIVCILLLVSSLAARRLPINQVGKMILAWFAIFFALYAVFAFRFEFVAIWDRIKADVAGTASQSIDGEAITIKRQDDGHYWLQVNVNDQPVRFMIDSGATTTAINAETAKEAAIEIDEGGYPVILSTANGRVIAKRGLVRAMDIGTHQIKYHNVIVSEAFGDTNVLGMNFLDSLQSWKVEGNIMTLNLK